MRRKHTHSARPAYWGGASTFLHQHRGMARMGRRGYALAGAAGLVLLAYAAWFSVLQEVGLFWGHLLAFWNSALDLPGRVVMTYYDFGGFMLPVAHLDLPASAPGAVVLGGTAAAVLALFTGSFFVPQERVPLRYFLRVVAVVQAVALLYFNIAPEAFPYTLAEYTKGLMLAGLCLISLVPLLLGLTYYLLDFRLWQKVGLTLLAMGHLILFVPMQYALHALVAYYGSLLFLPLLYLFGGLLLDVFVFVGFYAWGMSWEGRRPHGGTTPLEEPNRS